MALELFAPPIREWFTSRLGEPTEIQRLAWPRIASGRHLLVTAPTGSGKTLTAFLWALNQLATGALEGGRVAVLYVSPLRALGNDIQRNLLSPLAELPAIFQSHGLEMPPIQVLSRTGDTPPEVRQRMNRRPPEILITTPESLNILLTSAGGRRLLANVRTVILDEIHAVAGSKRGVHLITAVERLSSLAGEAQRIALSATVHPTEIIARWVGGYRLEGRGAEAIHHARAVEVVSAAMPRQLAIDVDLPAPALGPDSDRKLFWTTLTSRLKRRIHVNRSTLIFANSRRMVEKLARMINENEPEQLAYSHHGALSREIRAIVEDRLKNGLLKAVVATSSLELGIDIGDIDEVITVQSPPSVASTVQRVGRSGHRVGETSRGRLYPLHRRGLIDCTVVAKAAIDGDIEPQRTVDGALDVLAQVILSMTVRDDWNIDDLFNAVRCAAPYHHLPRHHFELVLDMLSGRYATTRLRALRPLVNIDAIDRTVRARPGSDRLIYLSGGTIADRGYFQLRLDGAGSPIGQLDEEFVWERSVGDTFSLGVQTWRVQSISHNDVFVTPAKSASAMAPFWRAEEQDRSAFVADRIGRFMEWAVARLATGRLEADLIRDYPITRPAAKELRRLLEDQLEATSTLPHRHQVVEEHTASSRGRGGESQIILHTGWGGAVNRPLAVALAAAWEARHGQAPAILHDDDCLVISHPSDLVVDNILGLVRPEALTDVLQKRLEKTGFFGARFREAAGCALLLPRSGHGRRTPLWLHRQRAKELLDAVRHADDFPIVLEAWRSCLQDHFDLSSLESLLSEVHEGHIAVQQVRTDKPSPFASQVLWKQTNELMYDDDSPLAGGGGQRIRGDLVREVALSPHLRPRLDRGLVEDLEHKLQRLAPGYSPRSASDLIHWVKERLVIPGHEWSALLEAIVRDHELDPHELDDLIEQVKHRVVVISVTGDLVVALESVPAVAVALGFDHLTVEPRPLPGHQLGEDVAGNLKKITAELGEGACLEDLLTQWLAFYGPHPRSWIASTLGIPPEALDLAVDALAENQVIVEDQLTDGASVAEVCDRDNLERLLRLARREQRPTFEPVSLDQLPLLLASHQELGTTHADPEDLQRSLEALFGYPAPAASWESEFLPARINPFQTAWLDGLLTETDLRWIGCGERRLFFALDGDRELFVSGDHPDNERQDEEHSVGLFPHSSGRYLFHELMTSSGMNSANLGDELWKRAWSGRISADSFAPVRRGLESGFTIDPAGQGRRSASRRGAFDRWRQHSPLAGRWFGLPPTGPAGDALDEAELDRDRARVVLDRYGIVFRQLLARELPALRWSRLFRALRLLELGGEVVTGCFIDKLPGLQFASHATVRRLMDGLNQDHVWWLNATDPASPCGLGIDGLDPDLPSRLQSNHLVFHGREVVVISERSGSRLRIRVAADHPDMTTYLEFLKVLVTRDVRPKNSLSVDEINSEPAAGTDYRSAFETIFHVTKNRDSLRLSRRY